MHRFNLLMLLTFFLLGGFSSWAGKTEAPSGMIENELQFLSEYRTYGDLLNNMLAWKIITQQDHGSFVKYLEERKISLNQKLIVPKISKQEIAFGKTILKYDQIENIYRLNGTALRIKSGETVFESFLRFQKIVERRVSLNTLFIPPVYAGEMADGFDKAGRWAMENILNNVGAGIEWGVSNGMKHVVVSVASCSTAFLGSAIGGAGIVGKAIIHPIRSAIYDLSITCDKYGNYVVNNVKFNVVDLRKDIKNSIDDRYLENQGFSWVSRVCTGIALNGVTNFSNLFTPKAISECQKPTYGIDCSPEYVNDSELKAALVNSKEKDCKSETTARIVENHLKKRAGEIEKATITALNSEIGPGIKESITKQPTTR